MAAMSVFSVETAKKNNYLSKKLSETKAAYESKKAELDRMNDYFGSYPEEKTYVLNKIREYFPENFEKMARVSMCESSLDPSAVSHTGDFGLMQVNQINWGNVPLKDRLNVDINLKRAKEIFDSQGIGAWDWSSHCWDK